MHWNSLAEFIAMGGRAAYVWGAFGMVALAFLLETLWLLRRQRRLRLLAKQAAQSPQA